MSATVTPRSTRPLLTSANPHVGVQDVPKVRRPLALTCGLCGATRRYRVGAITVRDPAQKPRDREAIESLIGFSGVFHCRACGAGGPWRLPDMTFAEISILVAAKLDGVDEVPVIFGDIGTFDGHCYRYGSESEDHLRELLTADPENAFLWTRLGNLHFHSGSREEAVAAYRRALDLDPTDIEAHSMYGQWLVEADREMDAVPHFHAVLKHVRNAQQVPKDLRRKIIRCTIEALLEAHARSKGAFKLFPATDSSELPEPPDGEPLVLELRQFDLSTERDMREMCDMFLGERRRSIGSAVAGLVSRWNCEGRSHRGPAVPTTRVSPMPFASAGTSARPREDLRVPRNSSCPCGSGRKYKKCCGR